MIYIVTRDITLTLATSYIHTTKRGRDMLKATDQQIIEALRGSMGIVTQAAYKLRMQRTYLHKRIRDSTGLKAALDDIREENLDLAESKLFEMIQKGDKIAIIFFLKCLGKSRGYVERQEVTGKEGVQLGQIAIPIRATSAEEWVEQNRLSAN